MADIKIDEETFLIDEVSVMVKDTIEATIGGNVYNHAKVQIWTNAVTDNILAQLAKLEKHFKYVVTCSIMQKSGAGLHTASACYWDTAKDGICTVRWENKSMYCVVSVFGLGI